MAFILYIILLMFKRPRQISFFVTHYIYIYIYIYINETIERSDITTPLSVYNKLKSLNPNKASGPDGISNWVLKEYAELLANPI